MRDLSLLDKIIVGRVEPHIYAFTTNTIPNYIKVGDTYRPVSVRLNEWKKHYPELEKKYDTKAMVSEDIFFRDYSVHQFLENDLQKERLTPTDVNENIYFSNEFFKDTSVDEIDEAINDIKRDFEENLMKYQFYNANDNLRVITEYASTGIWKLRPNQLEVVNNFKKAYEAGRTNLLLYAVMRFGKSFTSMCCALEMNANIVLIVSAKADVKEEWKKTVQSAENFKDYDFIENEQLLRDNEIIKNKLTNGRKVVIFLTLQDLQGTKIKEKHQELFNNKIDLLLIDETHFGARAESYGAVLRDVRDNREDENIDFEDADNIVKVLKSKVRIHLSGTPYRILMGSEFEKEDIIGFYQFPDIVKAQSDWDKEHILEDSYKEWENPYYGFPQMVRFAFNPNKSIREKLLELKKLGITYAFSELFRPLSITKDSEGKHQKFKYEAEILELLEVIDGSKNDDEVLGFLDFDKIKKGKMCRHIVIVLPFCASCDSLEKLIKDNKDKFKNLNEYEIINISGVDESNSYRNINDIKYAIKNCEKDNKKTITLTVNRMLTGSTVEEWDTMIYLKDTSSPQEYDQAIFRLQNQYVKEYVSEDGDIIKYNKKPQTLLVDFNPNRMFIMQETKSLIYNVNTENNGNDKLKERLENELNISPIIVFDSNKLKQITAIDIMNYISDYSNSRSVLDESNDLPVDFKLLNIDEIREIIFKQAELGSKGGLKLTNTDDDTDEFEELSLEFDEELENQNNETQNNTSNNSGDSNDLKKTIVNKFKTYYVRILFYSFLSGSKLNSLKNIIDTYEDSNNKRIMMNLELDINVLRLIYENIDPFILSQLDYKIQNINKLSNDESLDKIDRALVAINKFNKLSESEIVTPSAISNKMVSLIPADVIKKIVDSDKLNILDIASKEGEFSIALYSMMKQLGVDENVIREKIFAIPTSNVAYEFVRKIYEILNLNIDNISKNFNSYDLLEFDNNEILEFLSQEKKFSDIELEFNLLYQKGSEKMKFDLIIGNPPYQKNIGDTSDEPIYNKFMEIAYNISNKTCLITPAKFLFNAGKTPKEWNKKMLNDEHFKVLEYYQNSSDVFEDISFTGGVAISYYDRNDNFGKIETFLPYKELASILNKVRNDKFTSLSSIIYSPESYKFSEILHNDNPNISNLLSLGHKYDIVTNIFSKLPTIFLETPIGNDNYIKFLGLSGRNRIFKYIKDKYVKNHDNLKYYKVFLPKSNGSGAIGETIPTCLIGEPLLGEKNVGHTQSFISIGKFDCQDEAIALLKYLKTKFSRVLLGTLKVTQDNKKDAWLNVPIQDFTSKSDIDWSKSIKEIDYLLYKKYNLTELEINFIEKMIKEM